MLDADRDATMFVRSNMHVGGFDYAGAPRQAKYFGAFADELLVGMVALCWNGMVLLNAPRGLEPLLGAIVGEAAARGPDITGFGGPTAHVAHARLLLDLSDLPYLHDIDAGLYALTLDTLRLPRLLEASDVLLRRPRVGDLSVLVDWDIGYRIEALGERRAAAKRDEIVRVIAQRLGRGMDNVWLLERDGTLVSRSIFGAGVSGMVQIGGVWTPPEARGKGNARAVVAGSLRAAAVRGVRRAVLVAHDPAAIRAYEAIGFKRVGGYTLITFAQPVTSARCESLLNASPYRPRRPTAA